MKLDYTAGNYSGLDRFGRIIDQYWAKYDGETSTAIEEYKYGYDASGNVAWKENIVAGSKNLDELYTYDKAGQLKSVSRGNLSTAHDVILSGTQDFAQQWTPDGFGNWASFVNDSNGDGNADLNQTRTTDAANEITGIGENSGQSQWVTPTYDKSGNMTTVPNPTDQTTGLTAKYDAWNRLVKVTTGSGENETTVAQYEYDGAGRRIERIVGSVDEHFYYAGSEVIETRNGTSATEDAESLQPKYQYVLSARGTDTTVLRDENTDSDGRCDDGRLYYLNDPNNNVTALTDANGNVVERYVYDPFGKATIYNGDWSQTQADSAYHNVKRFTGREFDEATGLYYYRSRWYDSSTGTFMSRDAMGLAAGDANLHRYVGNNPISHTDAFGFSGGGDTWNSGREIPDRRAQIGEIRNIQGTDFVWTKLPDGRENWVPVTAKVVLIGGNSGFAIQMVSGIVVNTGNTNTGNMTVVQAAVSGLATGGKAIVNGTVQVIVSTVTMGTRQAGNVLTVTQQDIANGYNTSLAIVKTTESIVIAVATSNSCGLIGTTLRTLQAGSNVSGVVLGVNDMILNGVTLQNSIQVAGNGLALGINVTNQLTAQCFAAGTPLLTPEGAKPIEQIKAGDWVLSAPEDDPSAPVTARRVEELFQRTGRVIELCVGGRSISTTHEHPFYVEGQGWKQACALVPGDLLKSHDGQVIAVESLRDTQQDVTLYNMRIEEYHTYFVGSDAWGFSVWAHNANCGFGSVQFGNEVHQNFRDALVDQTGTKAEDWLMRTDVGQTGVDAEYIGPDGTDPGFTYAELKPATESGFDTFLDQIHRWGLSPGSTQLWGYDANGNIFSTGHNY